MGRYILTDNYTGEIIDTAPLRRTYPSKRSVKRSRPRESLMAHHAGFVALALGLCIALVSN